MIHRIGENISHYRILEEIGQGGMGIVFRAEDTNLRRTVALKFLPPELSGEADARERFTTEAQAASALQHNNICTIHDIDRTSDGQMFIVMDLYDGETLKQKTDRGPLSPDEALDIAIQIGQGLARAHDRGIVHRDIKPANVLVTEDGTAKILDFGLAKLGAGGMLTKVGTTLGTVAYMSPEQARGEDVDRRTDIWSLGVILYQMLTGRLPFSADHEQAVIYMIQNSEPLPAPGVPKEIQASLTKALQKDLSARYQHVRDFLADLRPMRGAGTHESSGARPSSPGARRPSRALVIGGAGILLALIIGGYLLYRPDAKNPGQGEAAGDSLPRLAVLPFTNLRSDPQTDFLGFALADQIIGDLAYIRTLIVRPASAIRKYQNQNVEPATAGRDLNANLILAGNYLKEANTIRLSLELVDVQTNAILWRDALQEEYENAFKLQDTVARKVVDGLRIHFSPEELSQMQADVSRNPLAYEYYLKGVSYPVTTEGNQRAVAMFQSSLALDSTYAPAFSELAYRLHQLAVYVPDAGNLVHAAESAALKALTLNDRMLSAHATLISLYTELGRTEEAYAIAKKVLSVNPNSPEGHFFLGYIYRYVGFLHLAEREMETAVSLDPNHPRFRSIGVTYLYLGKYDQALRGFDLDSTSSFSNAWKADLFTIKGEPDRALHYADRVLRIEPGSGFGLMCSGVKFYIEKKFDQFRVAIRTAEQSNVVDGENWYNIAQQYGLAGEASGAARTIARAVAAGFFNYPLMLSDPHFKGIRGNAEFESALAVAKAKYEAFKVRYPELQGAG